MELQAFLDMEPGDAKQINSDLCYIEKEGKVTIFNATMPIFSFNKSNKNEKRIACAVLSSLGLAKMKSLAEVFEVNRSTIYRNKVIYEKKGLSALVEDKTPRSPHKLTDEKVLKVQKLLDDGITMTKAAKELGITEGTIRYGIKKGRLHRRDEDKRVAGLKQKEELIRPGVRNEIDKNCKKGVAVKRNLDEAISIERQTTGG